MIPSNITRANVIDAIKEIARKGTPSKRQSRDFLLLFEDKSFPPKYVISIANRYANGVELGPSTFSGGKESNMFLTNLGFEISGGAIGAFKPPQTKPERHTQPDRPSKGQRHNERCPECKQTVRKLLERIYGEVRTTYSIALGTLPGEFINSPFHGDMEEIYRSLQECRGNADFVYARVLPPVDYFIPSHNLIVEFDESQHFTICRKLALSRYPRELQLGFDRVRWMELCDKIHAQDNDPPYRDEQRAWYDTLRDLVPSGLRMRPTIRLYAGQRNWCSLDPQNKNDVKEFESILQDYAKPHKSVQPVSIDLANVPKSDVFRVALVLPEVWAPKKKDVTEHPQAPLRFKPSIPVASIQNG